MLQEAILSCDTEENLLLLSKYFTLFKHDLECSNKVLLAALQLFGNLLNVFSSLPSVKPTL